MEGRTNYERFVGGSEEDKERARKNMEENFNEKSEDFSKYELEKTSEDLDIIEKTEFTVNEIVAQYGGEIKSLPLDDIYILKPNSVSEITEGEIWVGICRVLEEVVGVEKKESKLKFAASLAHELFHLKSYKAASTRESSECIYPYRSGISMFEKGGKKIYFSRLEEAIVAECTKIFLEKIKEKDESLKKEYEANEKLKKWFCDFYFSQGKPEEEVEAVKQELFFVPDAEEIVEKINTTYDNEESRRDFAAGTIMSLYENDRMEMSERHEEREEMYKLLDDLVVKSNGRFKDRNEVFDCFARANFSGRYLDLAHTVEGILGKGSFRKIAEEFSEDKN